jgi:hypothetical protein
MATPSQIRTLATAKPFRPYRVRLASGHSYLISHPENAACGLEGRSTELEPFSSRCSGRRLEAPTRKQAEHDDPNPVPCYTSLKIALVVFDDEGMHLLDMMLVKALEPIPAQPAVP